MEQARPNTWQIITYRAGEQAPPRFAVWHEGRRRSWGVRDQAAATRWLQRLSAPPQTAPAPQTASMAATDTVSLA